MRVKISKYDEFKRWCSENGYADVVLEMKEGLDNFDRRKFLAALDDYARFRTTNESPWLTPEEVARRLKLTTGTVYNYMKQGLIPFCKSRFTGTRRIHVDDLDRWLQADRFGPE